MAANKQKQQQDWREKQYTSDELRSIYLVAGGIIIGLIGVFIGAVLFSGDEPLIHDLSGYWMTLSIQIVSIFVIILGVNWLAARREISRMKKRLVYEASSKKKRACNRRH